jgi:hypothetical protein
VLDRSGRGRARWLAAGGAALAALLALAGGCGRGQDDGTGELRAVATSLLGSFGVAAEREPATERSKDVEYVVGDGTARGDLATVVERVATALAEGGWDLTTSAPLEAPASGPAAAHRLVAARDDVAVQVLVAGTLGTTPAPAGSQWVQLSVARRDDRLSWTPTS